MGLALEKLNFSKRPYQFQQRSSYSWVTGSPSGAAVSSSTSYRCQELLKPPSPAPNHLHSPHSSGWRKSKDSGFKQWGPAARRGARSGKVLSSAQPSRRRARSKSPARHAEQPGQLRWPRAHFRACVPTPILGTGEATRWRARICTCQPL